ncbi:MAG: ABC transporter permease [Pseudomonadota bacterium]
MSQSNAASGLQARLQAARHSDVSSLAGSRSMAAAVGDVVQGLLYAPLWFTMAWQDIRQRYRRSTIGPFWLTLSMGILVGTLGFLYGALFQLPIDNYLPFLALGFLAWGFISGVINEGGTVFIEAETYVKQIKLPLSTFVYRIVCRNMIIFAHNSVVYIVVMIWFGIWPGVAAFQLIPSLALLLATSVWGALLLGTLCARFRDVPQIAASFLQVAFFLTPIIWTPELIGDRIIFVEVNPFYHFVELVRAPLLGQSITGLTWLVTLAITIGGWLGTLLFFRLFRARIAYWVS